MSYTDRLLKLGLPSLELRRLDLELVYCYKIVFWSSQMKLLRFLRIFSLAH